MTATPEQARLAQEVLDGTREVTGSAPVAPPQPETLAMAPPGLSEEAKQQALDVGAAMGAEIRNTTGGMGEPYPVHEQPELAQKQWEFERGDVAQSIQKTNDIKAPGE